jgi:hypothetical protein
MYVGLCRFLGSAALILTLTGCTELLGSSDSDKDAKDGDLESGTNTEILETLGFELDLGDPPEAAAASNPMGSRTKSFMTVYEIYQAGTILAGESGREALLEYDVHYDSESTDYPYTSAGPASQLSSLLDTPATDEMVHIKKSVAADKNGDGVDEIVTAVYRVNHDEIVFRVRDGKSGSVGSKTLSDLDSVSQVASEWSFHSFASRDFTAGDFNNDGMDDFAIAFFDTVLILDHNLDSLGSLSLPAGSVYPRVEAGELNDDGYSDLVVIAGVAPGSRGSYYIYAGCAAGLEIGGAPDPATTAAYHGGLFGSEQYSSGEVAIGDLDGNGVNELVFAGVLT